MSSNGNLGITDLSMLGNLVSVGQKLVLRNISSPTNFKGLDKLASVGAGYGPGTTQTTMDLYQQDSSGGITNYCGLPSLTTFHGRWRKHNNTYLDDPATDIPLPTSACP